MSKKLLREFIDGALAERFGPVGSTPQMTAVSKDIWDSSYQYTNSDGPETLVKSALEHFKKMAGQGSSSPADPKFLGAVQKRLQYIGVPEDVTKSVLLKLRMAK